MIEIKFTGTSSNIHEAIQSYLDQAGEEPHTPLPTEHHMSPLVHYERVDSHTDQYSHVITMLGQFPLACTCTWFRHNYDSTKKCVHMVEAAKDAGA